MRSNRASILVVNREGLGDNVLSMPLLAIISHEFKDCALYVWLILGRKDLFFGWDTYHFFDDSDKQIKAAVLSRPHRFVFDLGTSSKHITERCFQGELKYDTYVGFARPKSIPREVSVLRSSEIPMWQQFISLASILGTASDGIPDFRIQTSEADERYAEMLLDFDAGVPLICLAPGSPGALGPFKRWPPENFARVIQELHATRLCRFVLVGHPLDKETGDAISGLLDFEIDNLIGLTPLGSLVHILRRSKLLVANDNGAMHLGGVLGIPTIGLFGPSNPRMYGPMGTNNAIIVAESGNITDIDPDSVVEASVNVLKQAL